MSDLAYLDFAATSAVRPAAVSRAVAGYIDEIGASPGRGGHRLAVAAGRVALQCRQRVAKLLGLPGGPDRIAFTANATHALNQAIWGTVGQGERVVVTSFDHNAVLRPAARLARERATAVELIPGAPDGSIDEEALQRAVDGARLVCLNAASNVLGTVLDTRRFCAMAREAGALSLVDAAQIAGHIPFDGSDIGADMIAFSGHKGMLGPQGIGGLWVREGIDVEPLVTGGTGGDSLLREMPPSLPDRLEAGTLNGPAMAGLIAGIDAVLAEGVVALHARLAELKRELREGMRSIGGVEVLSPAAPEGLPIVLIRSSFIDAAALSARLDREHGVLTRTGLHCAPEAHRVLGTMTSGAVRFSLGWASTSQHVQRALDAVAAIVAAPSLTRTAWKRRSQTP
ncbi:aminotransferase class V-fold PLP-dependent enzyme [soil metagenome]